MRITNSDIEIHNTCCFKRHQQKFNVLKQELPNLTEIVEKLVEFNIAIPSWALGTGGTRFGRFTGQGEPDSIERKLEDVAILHSLNKSSGAISLHIPWDVPTDHSVLKNLAKDLGIKFDAVNSNTFQDQPNQKHSYKFGSLQSTDKKVRKQAIEHNIEVIKHGESLGSKSLTVWLSDGSSFPGQVNFRRAFQNTLESLEEIYSSLPADWKLFIEYKAFEPNFYSMTIGDWGQSLLYATKLGNKAFTLVDLGHHLPNANIEQIVALLLMENKLAGFHFNDSKYGDDDLTVGSINPYQLFLIFNELVEGMNKQNLNHATSLSWMIDASHNIKDPLEDLLQSTEAILIAYTQALLVEHLELKQAQEDNDIVKAQEILQNAFRTDVRTIVAEARLRAGGAIDPIKFFRENNVRAALIKERGLNSVSTGL
jgi:L-rhamnose isomerase/sugar isomerase